MHAFEPRSHLYLPIPSLIPLRRGAVTEHVPHLHMSQSSAHEQRFDMAWAVYARANPGYDGAPSLRPSFLSELD